MQNRLMAAIAFTPKTLATFCSPLPAHFAKDRNRPWKNNIYKTPSIYMTKQYSLTP